MVMWNSNLKLGQVEPLGRPPRNDQFSEAEKRLLGQIADKLLQEHSETLKKLGDE